MNIIGYPPAPTNGGRFDVAPPKIGEWVWQPKVNEWRGVVHVPTLTVWSQYGDLSTVEQQGKLANALMALKPHSYAVEWLDIGISQNRHDLMQGKIIIFDLMEAQAHSHRRLILRDRFPVLPTTCEGILNAPMDVYLINEWTHNIDMIWEGLQRINRELGKPFYEGLVAKRCDAPYPIQRRAKGKTHLWVKHRFDQ